MTTDKEDTDPSTPASLRPASARPPYSLRDLGARDPVPAHPNRPTTDPGLGPMPSSPPTSQAPLSPRSRGVVVPPPSSGLGPNAVTPAAGLRAVSRAPAAAALSSALARTKDSKDSVELLLDGMAGPRPERRKTTPQSDGEASASYHAQHGVHPAHALGEPGPKVVVERASAPPAPEADTQPTPPPPPASHALDTTFVPARNLARRIAMAVLAALLIVLAAFVGMDLVSPRTNATRPAAGLQGAEPGVTQAANMANAPGAPGTANTASVANAMSGATALPPVVPSATDLPLAATTGAAAAVAQSGVPSEVEVAKPAVSAQAESHKRRRHSAGESDDIGEFKTSF